MFRNSIFKQIPRTVHTVDNTTFLYFRRFLWQRVLTLYEIDVPKFWDKDYFLECLFAGGRVCVFDSKKFGVIPQYCTFHDLNVFYRPIYALVTNHLLPEYTKLKIGSDCELITLNSDYEGLLDTVNFYAEKMALTASTANTNIFQARFATLFACSNKAQAESYKQMYDKIAEGQPAVFFDKNLLDETGKLNIQQFNNNLHQNYIADNLLVDLKKWEVMFNLAIGIPDTATEKKERLIDNEISASQISCNLKYNAMLDRLQDCFDNVNSRYNLDLQIRKRKECISDAENESTQLYDTVDVSTQSESV